MPKQSLLKWIRYTWPRQCLFMEVKAKDEILNLKVNKFRKEKELRISRIIGFLFASSFANSNFMYSRSLICSVHT